MLRMSSLFLLFLDAAALYLSTLIGPSGNSGVLVPTLSQILTYNTDTRNTTLNVGFIPSPSNPSTLIPCTLTTNPIEAPLTILPSDAMLYTMCSSAVSSQTSYLVRAPIQGSKTYFPIGYTSSISNSIVSRLVTTTQNEMYILTRQPSGNSSVWYLAPGQPLLLITSTQDDGWQINHLTLQNGQLYASGTLVWSTFSSILTWGRGLPSSKQSPQRVQVGASSYAAIVTFTFSNPETLWIIQGSSAAGSPSLLQTFTYNRQTFSWILDSYSFFNTSQPVPTILSIDANSLEVYGVTPQVIVNYIVPIPTIGGGSSFLTARTLVQAPRGSGFRGLSLSVWQVPTQSLTTTATHSSTATQSSSSSATASASSTASASTSASASATSSTSASATASVTRVLTQSPLQSIQESKTNSPTESALPNPSPSVSIYPTSVNLVSSTNSPSSTHSPSTTNSTAPDSPAAIANQGLTEGEKLGLGFGLTGLLGLLIGCVVIYGCYKSGKLFTLFLKKPSSRSAHPRISSGQARDRPRSLAPVQLNINPAHLAKLNEIRVSMRIAEEKTQITEGGGFTVKTIKRTYAPMRIDVGGASTRTLSPLTNRMGTSV